MVAYVRGGQQPFVTRDAHLVRTPPTEAQIDGLQALALSDLALTLSLTLSLTHTLPYP